jgi:hypothetical protein
VKLEDYSKYYIQGSDHYLIPKDDLAELVEENQKLKQQLDKYENEPLTNKISRIDSVVSNIYLQNKTQQKEFIKYLEDEIEQNTPSLRWKHYNEDGFNDYDVENPSCIKVQPTDKIFKEILQKYKSIIGVSDENNIK